MELWFFTHLSSSVSITMTLIIVDVLWVGSGVLTIYQLFFNNAHMHKGGYILTIHTWVCHITLTCLFCSSWFLLENFFFPSANTLYWFKIQLIVHLFVCNYVQPTGLPCSAFLRHYKQLQCVSFLAWKEGRREKKKHPSDFSPLILSVDLGNNQPNSCRTSGFLLNQWHCWVNG